MITLFLIMIFMITISSLRITAIYFNRIAFHILPKVPIIMQFDDLHLTEGIKAAKDTLLNQSGIYCIQNTITESMYIGSSTNMGERLVSHLVYNTTNLHLQSAIAKYGLAYFTFIVIELCAPKDLLVREQFYLDWLFSLPAKLRYNFLPTAGSSLGSTHTEEAKMKMRGPRPHFSPSAEQRESISQANTGKVMSKVTRASISKTLSRSVYLYDTKDQLVRVFSSYREAANWLNVSKATVSKYVRSRKVLNGLYTLRAS
jgi:group I intron endonuclease